MIIADEPAPIFFVHIPKCAGSTLHSVFEKKFRSHELLISGKGRNGFRDELLSTPTRFLAQKKYIGGHYTNFDCLIKIGTANKITVLREPLQRLQSLINHAIRDRWPYYEDFVRYAEGEADAINGYMDEHYYVRAGMASFLTNSSKATLGFMNELLRGGVERWVNPILSDYWLVLVDENIDKFIDFLDPHHRRFERSNRMVGAELGPYREFALGFDQGIVERLALDRALYDYALQNAPGEFAFGTARRSSWILDWTEPLDHYNFSDLEMAQPQLSIVPSFEARLFRTTYGVLRCDGFHSDRNCVFSGIICLDEVGDIDNLTIRVDGKLVPYKVVDMSTWPNVVFYGQIPSHKNGSFWEFEFTEKPRSPLIWFNDFCIHRIDRTPIPIDV